MPSYIGYNDEIVNLQRKTLLLNPKFIGMKVKEGQPLYHSRERTACIEMTIDGFDVSGIRHSLASKFVGESCADRDAINVKNKMHGATSEEVGEAVHDVTSSSRMKNRSGKDIYVADALTQIKTWADINQDTKFNHKKLEYLPHLSYRATDEEYYNYLLGIAMFENSPYEKPDPLAATDEVKNAYADRIEELRREHPHHLVTPYKIVDINPGYVKNFLYESLGPLAVYYDAEDVENGKIVIVCEEKNALIVMSYLYIKACFLEVAEEEFDFYAASKDIELVEISSGRFVIRFQNRNPAIRDMVAKKLLSNKPVFIDGKQIEDFSTSKKNYSGHRIEVLQRITSPKNLPTDKNDSRLLFEEYHYENFKHLPLYRKLWLNYDGEDVANCGAFAVSFSEKEDFRSAIQQLKRFILQFSDEFGIPWRGERIITPDALKMENVHPDVESIVVRRSEFLGNNFAHVRVKINSKDLIDDIEKGLYDTKNMKLHGLVCGKIKRIDLDNGFISVDDLNDEILYLSASAMARGEVECLVSKDRVEDLVSSMLDIAVLNLVKKLGPVVPLGSDKMHKCLSGVCVLPKELPQALQKPSKPARTGIVDRWANLGAETRGAGPSSYPQSANSSSQATVAPPLEMFKDSSNVLPQALQKPSKPARTGIVDRWANLGAETRGAGPSSYPQSANSSSQATVAPPLEMFKDSSNVLPQALQKPSKPARTGIVDRWANLGAETRGAGPSSYPQSANSSSQATVAPPPVPPRRDVSRSVLKSKFQEFFL